MTETSPEAHQLEVETLRTVILASLVELERYMPDVDRLMLAPQRGIGFATPESKAMQDEMLRKERAARHPKHRGPLGTKFMRPSAIVVASGERPYPANLSASSYRIEVEMTLIDTLRHFTTRLARHGVCLTPGLPAEPTLRHLLTNIRALTAVLARVGDLVYLSKAVEQLVERGKVLVEGDDKKRHPKPCPHCGRMSLVIYISRKVVVCEADPDTGKQERCICTDQFCQCRLKHLRHEWFANPKNPTMQKSWHQLADAQARAERADTNA